MVILFNNVFPETFNDELNVDELETIKLLKFVLFNKLVLVVFRLLIDKIELLDNEFKFENIVVLVALRFDIDVVWVFNTPKILVLVLCKLDIAVLLLFIEFNNDVEVKFKNDIDVCEFNIPKILVLVLCKLDIFEFVVGWKLKK